MDRTVNFAEQSTNTTPFYVNHFETNREFRTVLSILIPQARSASNAASAEVLGVGKATVVRMQKKVRNQVSIPAGKT